MSAPGYHGTTTIVNTHSPLQVARRRGWDVAYAKGCEICDVRPAHYPNEPCRINASEANTTGIAGAVAAAKAADIVVLFLGADQTTEAEGFDRHSLRLVGAQEALLQAVLAVSSHVVLVLVNGGPVDVSTAVESDSVVAILEAFQPGEFGGDAMIDIMDGSASPSAKMPVTTYFQNYTASRDIREGDLRAGSGTTYWWMREPVLFPFGAGLEFTTFAFSWSNEPPAPEAIDIPADDTELRALSIEHSVIVANTGARASPVVVLAFVVATPSSPSDTPRRKLFGFERLAHVAPGENATVRFASDAGSLGVVSSSGAKLLMAGRYRIEIGSVASPAVRELELRGASAVVEANRWAQALAGKSGVR